MKGISDLTTENINKIYSLIVGETRNAGKIEWSRERDFVVATFKVEDCVVSDDYDTVEFGIIIDSELIVDHIWTWKNSRGHNAIEHRSLYNHHSITKYLMDEGFAV